MCSYSWHVRRARRPGAAGEALPGAPGEGRWPRERRRAGCGLGGAFPRGGAAARRAGSAGAAGGTSWPRQAAHQGGCGRGALGSRRGARGGRWGGAASGRAATALRLLKSAQLLALRAASGRPARLPVSPRTLGRFQECRKSHVVKRLRVRNLTKLQSATKRKESPGRVAGGAEASAPDPRPSARPPPLSPAVALVPASDGGGRSRLRRSVRGGPEMGGGEWCFSALFRTGVRASRGAGDSGRCAAAASWDSRGRVAAGWGTGTVSGAFASADPASL